MEFDAFAISSPLGNLSLTTDLVNLTGIRFCDDHTQLVADVFINEYQQNIARQLREYFEGNRKVFDLPISFGAATAFQQQVWKALMHIHYGQTVSYKQLALVLGNVSLSRAVGAAVGQNPLLIVVPCHRVIGANGSLTGYAGGLKRKSWLLEHESSELTLQL